MEIMGFRNNIAIERNYSWELRNNIVLIATKLRVTQQSFNFAQQL